MGIKSLSVFCGDIVVCETFPVLFLSCISPPTQVAAKTIIENQITASAQVDLEFQLTTVYVVVDRIVIMTDTGEPRNQPLSIRLNVQIQVFVFLDTNKSCEVECGSILL